MESYIPADAIESVLQETEAVETLSKKSGEVEEFAEDSFGGLINHPLLSAKEECKLGQELKRARLDILALLQGAVPQTLAKVAEIAAQPRSDESYRALGVYTSDLKRELKLIAESESYDQWPAPLAVALACCVISESFAYSALTENVRVVVSGQRFEVQADQKEGLRDAVKRFVEARDTLAARNMRLVYSLVLKVRKRFNSDMDLLQEGVLGLFRAIEKYDVDSGYRFSTYAYNWIRAYVDKSIDQQKSMVQYPSHIMAEVKKIHRERLSFSEQHGRQPDAGELAALTGIRQQRVETLTQLSDLTISLEAPVFDREDQCLKDHLTSADTAVDLQCNDAQIRANTRALLNVLSEREAAIIAYRYGIWGGEAMTYAEVSDIIGLSRERIRQLEKSAIEQLRENEDWLQFWQTVED